MQECLVLQRRLQFRGLLQRLVVGVDGGLHVCADAVCIDANRVDRRCPHGHCGRALVRHAGVARVDERCVAGERNCAGQVIAQGQFSVFAEPQQILCDDHKARDLCRSEAAAVERRFGERFALALANPVGDRACRLRRNRRQERHATQIR
ncbi:hypothetical protein D9M72_548730 [compost metagenome]